MITSRTMKFITGSCEAILGIPIIGGLIVMGYGYTPLLIMAVLHIVAMYLSQKEGTSTTGSKIGLATSLIAWIPFVGMVMHIISAVFIFLELGKDQQKSTMNINT